MFSDKKSRVSDFATSPRSQAVLEHEPCTKGVEVKVVVAAVVLWMAKLPSSGAAGGEGRKGGGEGKWRGAEGELWALGALMSAC